MIDILKYIRCFVFLVFVISNAVTTSVAVWNLSIIEGNVLYAAAGRIDTYLIILGSLGLLLIFPIIFLEIYGKITILGKVWFELLWVGLFGVMELVGASFTTSQSTSSMCAERQIDSEDQTSPCTSTQVLIAFTWIPALLLLGYGTLLLILAFVKSNEDRSVWTSGVGTYPWIRGVHNLKSAPTSPQRPMFRSKTPVIYAPRPRRAGAPVLAYRSGIDSEYDVESFRPSPPPGPLSTNMNIMSVERPMPPIPATTADSTFQIKPFKHQPVQMSQPVFSTPFYHSSVQRVIEERPGLSSVVPQAPPAVQLGQVRRLPPSPPPLGDWPRLDATSRPRTKKTLPPLTIPAPAPTSASIVQPSRSQTSFAPEPEPQPPIHALPPPPQRQSRRQNPLPPPPPPQSLVSPPVSSGLPYLTTSIAPLQPRRARPSGPRRVSSDNHDDPSSSTRRTVAVPPPLDLSKISSYTTNPSAFR
ncbi:hypothetical protein CPB83DRAFT_847575 [Crepidotus variabilis]|uniref:MARVEL domain-containing protein n=1 Tax=Crepidotus variabilis TaxID=179855 RepID=A0A9P6JU89_9AGAR|nr:hypothetical protein CPB83DRAFT_847575 [Crepidotus variabilis]